MSTITRDTVGPSELQDAVDALVERSGINAAEEELQARLQRALDPDSTLDRNRTLAAIASLRRRYPE